MSDRKCGIILFGVVWLIMVIVCLITLVACIIFILSKTLRMLLAAIDFLISLVTLIPIWICMFLFAFAYGVTKHGPYQKVAKNLSKLD